MIFCNVFKKKNKSIDFIMSTPFNTSKGHRYKVYTNIIKKIYDFNCKKIKIQSFICKRLKYQKLSCKILKNTYLYKIGATYAC